jgi:hypothetical protein
MAMDIAELRQFTAKQLNRQAAKASKDEKTEKDKLKKVARPISSHTLQGTDMFARQSNKDTATSQKSTHKMPFENRTKDLISFDSEAESMPSQVGSKQPSR